MELTGKEWRCNAGMGREDRSGLNRIGRRGVEGNGKDGDGDAMQASIGSDQKGRGGMAWQEGRGKEGMKLYGIAGMLWSGS